MDNAVGRGRNLGPPAVDDRRTSQESFVLKSSQPMGSSPLGRNSCLLKLLFEGVSGAVKNTLGSGISKSFLLSPSRP